MKKIVQIIDQLTVGGAERMSVNIANALSEKEIPNALICTRLGGPLEAQLNRNCTKYILQKSSVYDLSNFIRFVKILRKEKPHIIHAHSSSVFWPIVALFFLSKSKIIWHDHNGNIEESRNYRRMIKLFSRRIDGIIVVNSDLLNWSLANTKVENIRFIRNFPSFDSSFKRKITPKFNIVLLANLRGRKNHMNALRAVKIIKEKSLKNWHMYFIGEDFHDEYSHRLKQEICDSGLKKYVSLIGAVDDVVPWLNKASLGLLTSDFDGLPVSLLEYGLASLPVVVTNVGQCSEVVDHANRSLVETNNPIALADAIKWHMDNREDSLKMGRKLKDRVKKEYGSDQFMREYLSLMNCL